MTPDNLPPLPAALPALHWQHSMYTSEQMRQYAAAAVAQARREGRERCAQRVVEYATEWAKARPGCAHICADCQQAIRALEDDA